LVLWGDRDPYLPTKFGEDYAKALPNASFERIEDAGHWPWVDDLSAIDRILSFIC
jgi:pimeloyl-ACP methyl ester carboxylesterase